MAEDSLNDVIAAVQARVREELEAQLKTLARRQDEALAAAREEAAASARAAHEAERDLRAATAPDASMTRLLAALQTIDGAGSLTSTLNAILAAAHAFGEATLFVATGHELRPWSTGRHGHEPHHAADEVAREALSSGNTASSDVALAVPLVIDRVPVGVLYAKRRIAGDDSTAGVLEAIARHGAAHLANLTLLRTAQAQQWISDQSRLFGASGATDTPGSTSEDETTAARRFARLLVSEIKLYNEGAVRVGRERRDLRQRLGEEIDRARRLYEERVPQSVPGRAQYFHNELVQTLAGGDPSLLG